MIIRQNHNQKGSGFMARRGENIYHRKDGRFEGRYIKNYDDNGKGITGYVYGKTYKEAKEKLTLAKAKVKPYQKKSVSEITVSEWFDRWLIAQKQLKQSSYSVYSTLINKHIKKGMGKMKLCDVTRDSIQNFIHSLSAILKPASVRSVYTVLKLGLDTAADRHLMDIVCKKIKLPKLKRKEVTVFTKQEQRQLESFIERSENTNDLGILISLYTGIRIGELCALSWENIDLKRGVISIIHTLYRVKNKKGKKKTELVLSIPKSESSVRDIPLPDFLVAKLKAIENGSGFFINRNGKFIEPTVYARRYKAILKELGIRNLKYHCTRHTFATRALEIGMDIKTLSEILGHSSPTVTLNIYAHSLPEHKQKEINRLGKLYHPSV